MDTKKDIQYSKKERAAIALLIILLMSSYVYNTIVKPEIIYDTSSQTLEELLVQKEKSEVKVIKQKAKNILSSSGKKKIFYNPPPRYETFDPNKTDSLKWIQFGLKPWTISTIIKYKAKGGKFYTCQDLSKLYNLPDSTYQKLLPYCKIPPRKWPKKKPNKKYKESTYEQFRNKDKDSIYAKKKKTYTPIVVNISNADTSTLCRLYGIGPVLSKRIVKYRKALGGFHSIEQLKDIYGLDPIVLTDNSDKLILDGIVNKLNINSVADTLVKHPYLDWNKAKIIVNYRRQHGDIENIADLKNIKVITDSLYRRLLPYLATE